MSTREMISLVSRPRPGSSARPCSCRVEDRVVTGRVDEADRRVVDLRAVRRVGVLVRRVAGGERALLLAGLACRAGGRRFRSRPRPRPACRRARRHVVGALAGDLEAPLDLARLGPGQADRDDVAEARPRDDQELAVGRRVHVVDELVVALADQLADREEVAEVDGVRADLVHALVVVGDDVDAGERARTRRPSSR